MKRTFGPFTYSRDIDGYWAFQSKNQWFYFGRGVFFAWIFALGPFGMSWEKRMKEKK